MLLLTSGAGLLAGCGDGRASEAEGYAMKACGITVTNGKASAFAADSGNKISIDVMALAELKSLADGSRTRSESAAAAAQIDPVWKELADAWTTKSSILSKALDVRINVPDREFWQHFGNQDIDAYNAATTSANTQCSALSTRLQG